MEFLNREQTKHESKKNPMKRGLGRGLASLLPAAFETSELSGEAEVTKNPLRSTEQITSAALVEAAKTSFPEPDLARVEGPVVTGIARHKVEAKEAVPAPQGEKAYFFCDIENIAPNPNQPRKTFDPVALDELTQSIQTHGLLSPIVVRRKNLGFEIIAGERRWRACQKAGLKKVPVLLKEVGEKAQYQLALIENLQRRDLSPVEEALGYEHLMDAYGLTQEKVAEQVGKDRSTVTNALRLLKLPQSVLDLLGDGKMSTGHAKALLGISEALDAKQIALRVVEEGWSVRMIEDHIRSHKAQKQSTMAMPVRIDPKMKDLQHKFEMRLSQKVEIKGTSAKGQVRIHFSSQAELNRIAEKLGAI